MARSLERDRLLKLLHRHGILYASDTQPVLSRDGATADWMLDSLCVSLGPEGIELAGKCLLALLERFDGRQIATYGTTAIPLVSSCVLQSQGRYHGLLVRKERKPHGSRKLIEGRIDPDEPVIIVDDSVSSGSTMEACCARLEEVGLRVEGGACLVRFGWYSGFGLMQERGYQMEAVYDIWTDFIDQMEDEPDRVRNPTKVFPAWRPAEQDATPDGLHPAQAARHMLETYLRSGELPAPPARFDREYDSAGGSWISIRSRDNIHIRPARDGFWHFPEEEPGSPGHDLALAAAKTAAHLPSGDAGLELLEGSAIAVTFFSALEECTPGELDNDRYGIVVRSRERPEKMGGALPRMPGISTAWQQFRHACRTNAGLVSFEPFQLLRHDVTKVVEEGCTWQPTGAPAAHGGWWQDAQVAGSLAERARGLVLEALALDDTGSTAVSPPTDAEPLDSVYVTIYFRGRIRGCMGKTVRDLDADLRELIGLALDDQRFGGWQQVPDASEVAVTVSLLFAPLDLGGWSPEDVAERVRHGDQALSVSQGERAGMLLPFMVGHLDLCPRTYALEVIDKAGITRPPYSWRRYDCVTWLADSSGVPRPLRGALPEVAESAADLEARLEHLAGLYSDYLLRHRNDDGRLYFRYRPHQGQLCEGGDLPRLAHGAWVLSRAGSGLAHRELSAAAQTLTDLLLAHTIEDAGGHPWLEDGKEPATVSEVSLLLLALTAAERPQEPATALAELLWSRIDRHGRIATHRDATEGLDAFQHYYPGQALLALAQACHAGCSEVREQKLERAFRYYRHRFRQRRDFGQVSWQMQAFTSWRQVLPRSEFAAYVFEIGDWVLEYQQTTPGWSHGGFLNDHQSDSPGYTTALYLEGLGAATRLARASGDDRAARYAEAYERGVRFLERLTIRQPMTTVLPNPTWAVGGVRTSFLSDEVRIDFVQHALAAVLELHPQTSVKPSGSVSHA